MSFEKNLKYSLDLWRHLVAEFFFVKCEREKKIFNKGLIKHGGLHYKYFYGPI